MTLPDTLTMPIALPLIAGCILLVLALERFVMPRDGNQMTALMRFRHGLGLGQVHMAAVIVIAAVWVLVFVMLLTGLLVLLWDLTAIDIPDSESERREWRFLLTKVVAMTGVLAAVVAFPVTLIRMRLAREQTDQATEALNNDKMNIAVADLYAQRQVTKWVKDKDDSTRAENGWQDDIPRRNGAIDRLKGLSDEIPGLRPRVDRMLTVYLHELSKQHPAQEPPRNATADEMGDWARRLPIPRSDVEFAAQTLSRLNRSEAERSSNHLPDLAKMNLQGINLSGLFLEYANLSGAQLQGANMFGAQLRGADMGYVQLHKADMSEAQLQGAYMAAAALLWAEMGWAQLQGANLSVAQLQGANLFGAQLQGADMSWAELQGANMFDAQFDSETKLIGAALRGAAVRNADFTTFQITSDQIDTMFGDATVKLPPDMLRPARFDVEYEDYGDFETAWRAFQREIGQDPDNPQ